MKTGARDSGFKHSELLLPYEQWEALAKQRRPLLDDDVRAWLDSWSLHDLATSPMDDHDRAQRRYGHYVGAFALRF